MLMKNFNSFFSQLTAMPKRLAMVLTVLFTVGVGSIWGETATYTLNSSNNGSNVTTGDVSWSISSSAITTSNGNCKLTGKITVNLPEGATLNKVSLTKSNNWGSGATVVLAAGNSTLYTFTGSGDFSLISNKTNQTYTFTKSGSSDKNAWVKSITVDYTITATQDPATITLSEAGATQSITGKYVGDSYQLPFTTTATCGDKTFVGWSAVTIDNYAAKPTTDFYEPGASVTLEESNIFYAVFATETTTSGGSSVYEKVTTISNGSYLIASQGSSKSYAYTGQSGSNNYGGYTDVTITNDVISTKPTNAKEITISVDGSYFSMHDGTKYLYLSSDGNNLNFTTTETKDWTLSNGKIQNKSYTSRYLQYNTSSPRFACYKNTQQEAYLYKKSSSSTTTYSDYTTSCSSQPIISFDLNGSADNLEDVTLDGDTYSIPQEEPNRNGYNFVGWKVQGGDETVYKYGTSKSSISNITESITLVAQWSVIEYTITYNNLKDATNSNKTTYTIEDAITFATPTNIPTGYAFKGWNPASIAKGTTGNKTVEAQWTPITYKITYTNLKGATNGNQETYTIEDAITFSAPTNLPKGYDFTGWNPTSITVGTTGDKTVEAQWTPTTYTITYDNLGGASNTNPTEYTIESETINFVDPGTRDGYIFKGWEPASIAKGSTGNQIITAKWCEILGDATGLTVQTDFVENGQTYVKFSWTPADNTKSHATKQVICIGKVGEEKKCTDLEGDQVWSGDLRSKLTPGEYEWTIQAIGDGTDYCDGEVIPGTNFTIVGYVVSFNTDGGNGDYNDVTIFEGETFTLPAAPTKANYTFKAWSDGTNLYQPGAEISNLTEDLTLTAIWLTTTTLSWSEPTCTATIASPSNVFPELTTTPADLQGVQYSSSKPTVATIDANGNIVLKSAGETTITASFAEDATYAASEASYTLTVVESDNCKWVEIDKDDIQPTDEVVVTMGNSTTVYALHNSEKLTHSPKALQVAVQNGVLVGTDFANYGWYVTNIDGGYQLQSCSDASKYLYGVASYITLGKNPTTFSIYQDQETGNECFVYIANSKLYYLNHGTEDGESAWKKVESASYLKSNTLKFYKKECLPANEYWVTYDLENVTCTTDPRVETVTSTSEDFELTFTAADGYILTNDIEVQMEGGELEISWKQDKGKLTIHKPNDGFAGNITISLAACLSLPAPQNLNATDITSSSVTLTWDAVAAAQSYEVFVTDFDKQDITRNNLTECQVTISELTNNTEFTWDVRAVAEGYCGIPSELGTFTTLQTFTVTFDNNGHANAEFMPAVQTVDDGSLAKEPADDPSDNGYSFGGWYDNKNCEGDPFNFSETPITANTVLYAKWDVVTYNIAYAGLEGATNHANNPTTYTIETPTITFLAPSTRSGYIFSGWNPAALEKGNYGNKTITATWEKGKIVTWIADDNEIESQTYASGDKLVLPTQEIEACQGSAFVGWTAQHYSHPTDAPAYVTAGSEVTTDATYYAVYANLEGDNTDYSNTYTSNVAISGTDAKVVINSVQYDAIKAGTTKNAGSVEITIPAGTTKLCFHMAGWNGENGKTISLSGATAKPASFTTVADAGISGSGTTYTLSGKMEDYVYSTELTNVTEETTITLSNGGGNQRFVVWGVNASSATYKNYSTTCSSIYNITYDLNGGENGCENGSVSAGGNYTICAEVPTKTGYTFQHWVDEVENTYEAGATIQNVQNNITLTAVWVANEYTITWMSNGEEQSTTTHTYDQTLEVAPAPYNCYGAKTFIGWTEAETVEADGSDITYVDETTNPSENKTYYAVFADEEVGEPETEEATLSFADKAQRTSFSSTQQVWTQNGITLTNDKANAQSNVADYANPARFYASSSISLTAPGNITKIVFTCSESKYATALATSIGVTSSDTKVTATLDGKSNTFSIASLSAQVQMNSLTVTYQTAPSITRTNYTTEPTGCAEMQVAENAYVTSANGQSVKVKIPVTVNFQDGYTIEATIGDGTKFELVSVSEITDNKATVTLAYKPDYSNNTENTSVQLTAKYGENFVTAKSFTLNGRSLPETFAIVAKVGNMWYALPEVGYEAEKHATAYPVEVDDIANPTTVTSAVANNAAWSLRQVYESSGSGDRYVANGTNIVLKNNQTPAKALEASSIGNYLLTGAQFDKYHNAVTPGLYEWTPTTTDLETYTLTNVQRTDKQINISTNAAFGLHASGVTNQVRFLPIQNTYTTLATQVVEWKEKSVVIMYNGDPAQTASVSVNGGTAQTATLSAVQKDIAVYELPATGLAANPGQMLKIVIGTEQLLLSIPYIIIESKVDKNILSGTTVAERQEVAKVSDLVILKDGTLTADGASGNYYKFRNVTIYGGGKLVVPADKGIGVNTLTLRIGGVTPEGNYDYVYPEFDLRGTYSNTSGKINLDYVTTKSQYYTFVAPFEVKTKDIKYPVDIYGSNVEATNRGSFEFQYYDGGARANGEKGWKVVEEDPTDGATLTAHQGYTFYGMPKKVSVNGGSSTRQKFGIHRIPMSVTATDVMNHEKTSQNTAVSAYPSQHNINAGWNLIGNPYMATITGLNNNSIQTGTIIYEDNKWQWSNAGSQANRFIVFPSNDGEWYYTSQASNATLPAFKNFFVQIANESADALSIPRNTPAAQAPARRAAQEAEEDIELAIVLEQDAAHADQLDFLINDAYSALYDHNADFTKMMNNTQLNLYGLLMEDNLSFVAVDHLTAKTDLAIGYQVPAAGEYTLRLSDKPYVMWSRVDALYVTDHEVYPELTTNLLEDDYTFQVGKAETNTTRFTVSVVPSKESGGTTTGVDDLLQQDKQTRKFIYNDQLFILRDGVVYDAMGQRIMTINK